MYILRDGKVEFTGNKKEVINYIRECYEDDYFVHEYGNIFDKDWNKFKYTLEGLGLFLSNKKPRRKNG